MTATTRYTFGTTVAQLAAQVKTRVEAALQTEGFGVLTEIDVAVTLKAKLGIDRRPYLILGACNPTLVHAALEVDPSIGALLPCNVVLREDEPGITEIEVLDPGGRRARALKARLSRLRERADGYPDRRMGLRIKSTEVTAMPG